MNEIISIKNHFGTKNKDLVLLYISDLHIDAKCKTEEECYNIGLEVATSCETYNDNNTETILFILGDLAENVNCIRYFWQGLRSSFKGQVCYIFGNHELRNEDTILNELAKEINFIDLEHKSFHTRFCLGRELIPIHGNMLLSSNSLIKKIENKEYPNYQAIIYAGTGGDTYDKEHGWTELFENRDSLEKGIINKNFLSYYNDIFKEMLKFNIPLIVATHYPLHCWCKDSPIKGLTYLSGHTHGNKKEVSDYIYLADNQIGNGNTYTVKPLYFKKPTLEIQDGIYPITLFEYFRFINTFSSHSMSAPKQESPYWKGQIYMIKKDKYYMFVIKSKSSLSILTGGQKKKAKYDLNYYYENLAIQAEFQKGTIGKYLYDYLSKVSSYIKINGGSGYIHGLIVDIDFYSHVFVNPFNLTITPYTAEDAQSRIAFSSIPALLKANPNLKEIANEDTLLSTFPIKYATDIDGVLIENNDNKIINRLSIYANKLQRTINDNIVCEWFDNREEILKKIEQNNK